MSDEEMHDARQAAVACATAVLEGRLGVLEGCKLLSDLAHSLVASWFDDDDFLVFGGLADESDALPTGTARQYWSAEALEREDLEIARYEALVRDQGFAACRNVVARFKEEPSASV
jgi:hypothetical protein